jgi:hypothetical protein
VEFMRSANRMVALLSFIGYSSRSMVLSLMKFFIS